MFALSCKKVLSATYDSALTIVAILQLNVLSSLTVGFMTQPPPYQPPVSFCCVCLITFSVFHLQLETHVAEMGSESAGTCTLESCFSVFFSPVHYASKSILCGEWFLELKV